MLKITHTTRTLLFAGAIAAAASTQPEPAFANSNGAGIALGIIGGIIVGAAAAQASHPPQPYYPSQPAYASTSAACQSWLTVVNDPRYDTATRTQAQQIVSGCGLPYSTGGGPAVAPAPAHAPMTTPKTGATEIALTGNGGSHYVNGTVNGAAVQFILDTGADFTAIPLHFARQLAAQGRLSPADVRGVMNFGMANGSTQKAIVITLSSVSIGGRTVHNVIAAVNPVGSDPLLGQSFLQNMGSYTIDNRRNVLILG
jgi:clan AA aspartic protease (TIGR02281 family)